MSSEQIRLGLSQAISTDSQANIHALLPDGLDNHPTSDRFGNHDDIACLCLRPTDVGSHKTGGGYPFGHGMVIVA